MQAMISFRILGLPAYDTPQTPEFFLVCTGTGLGEFLLGGEGRGLLLARD